MTSSYKEIFEHKLSSLFKTEPESAQTRIIRMMSLYIHQNNTEAERTLEVLSILGLEDFIRLSTHLNGEKIRLPSKDELIDSVIFALCYYYREYKGLEWPEIQEIIPFEFASQRYTIRIKNMNKFIAEKLNTIIKSFEEGNNGQF